MYLEAINLKLFVCVLCLLISYPQMAMSSSITDGIYSLAKDIGVNVHEENSDYATVKANTLDSIFRDKKNGNEIISLYLNDKLSLDELVEYADSDKDIQRLRIKVKEYKKLTQFNWPSLELKEYKLGQKAKSVAKLRWMLVSLGDLQKKEISAYREQVYDSTITKGIKLFQKRHGLKESGLLTAQSIELLNVHPNEIVSQLQSAIKIKLSGIKEKENIYIEVNIAEFKLKLKGDDGILLQMPVIVGRPTNKTPLLNTSISHITINPTWTPPHSIIYNELLPDLKSNNNYLYNQRFVLVERLNSNNVKSLKGMSSEQVRLSLKKFKLVQTPGYWNALGSYRFTIPNSDSIFLHDTPNKNLFFENNRALSHGCIRLAKPELLANYLISRERADKKRRLINAKQGSDTVSIKLDNPISIIITNQIIWVDKDGLLQVRASVYNQEGKGNG